MLEINFKKLKIMLSGLFGGITASIGVIGSIGLCGCYIPIFAALVAMLGIYSLYLIEYHLVFMGIGTFLIVLSIYLFYKGHQKNK